MALRPLRIGTRGSAMALFQANLVRDRLVAAHPGLAAPGMIELAVIRTTGDRVQNRLLAEIGGKGLFLKELEVAMLARTADIAVHSYKDVPMELEPGFVIGAVLERADAADAFISNAHAQLDQLPHGARVGTSSLRRQAQLRALRPDLQLLDLRGNVNTRLAKLDAGAYDALVLACAGVDRLGLGARIRARLAPPQWLPAVGQGAIAIECRAGDEAVQRLVGALDDAHTHRCVAAERAMNLSLHGSCNVPIAGWCIETETGLALWGLVGDAATGRLLRAEAQGADAQELGGHVASLLRDQGAARMLAGLARD